MKIIKLQANNIKKLTAISITPEGNVVTLAGDNGAGKSSVLDAIAYALGGLGAVCEQPIRRGASNAEVICQLEGLTVTRKFSATGATLKVESADGVQRSPQAILDTLVGNLAFDPLAFTRLKPAEQADTVRRLAGLDFSGFDAARQKFYDERTVVNRGIDAAQHAINANPFDDSAPGELVSPAELVKQLEQAQAVNRKNAAARAAHLVFVNGTENARQAVTRIADEIEQLKKALIKAEQTLADCRSVEKASESTCSALKDVDCIPIHAEIAESDAVNKKVAMNQMHIRHKKQLDEAVARSNALTKQIADIDAHKQELLAKAKYPLPGLSFDESGVLFNGFPFAQCSSGEQLRISVAVGMALNPKLRVIFIRDGSLLDAAGLRTIAEMATAHDYQVWVEDARSTDPAAVVIKDGQIKQV